ncbi:MAG: hypothetical protein QME75_00510 [Deltaproteobacteria bacterium]|nr:hypothetical protein [Deltaproteobacteria bacterium]
MIFMVKGYSEEVFRSALSFNNPNQLGYYALFLACLAGLLMHWKEKEGGGKVIYFWCDFLIFSLAHLLMLLSLSRGALAAILLIDLWILPRLTKKITIFFLPLLTLSLISAAWQPEIIQEKLAGRPGKSMEAGEVTQDLSQRVIHQLSIMEGFHYLIGRGGVSLTWKDKADNIGEVHNIFGEVFRCYGLIGLGLFCVWLILMVWRSRVVPGGLYIWAALILYNMSHYGLRFRSFWILLALLNAMIYLESRRNNKNMEFVANARRRAIEEEMIKKRKLWALTRSSPPAAKV